ncbi:response regulator [Pseudomonas sp. Fig-3]|jgi:FixJ family two-component response regulator|uniref:Two-component system response regulator n=1 Tax=Pseudomonas rhizophila TaxID=2045200 RepID=A0ABM6UB77_9PSED|nr:MULTISPECIES: response regulator [Pseudomonas]AVU74613.1 two-component system response regulator [Pseudomonas rhizophila]MBD0704159.1 two-component system response regulator [Pseudomonas sp. PSB1]MDR8386230.1 response regulator [Pseudomonas sp. JL2]MEA1030392.1 response regulator [Pseudomonas sp. N-137]QKJ36404.1 response regulator [Pseudomonas sp. MPDS]
MHDTPKRNTATIAVVDDDESVRTALEGLLRSSGYQVQTYRNALAFLDANTLAETHCLISDIQMPGMSGVQLHEKLNAMGFQIPTIFITAYPHLGADTPGLVACLPKPCEAGRLLGCIETAVLQRH